MRLPLRCRSHCNPFNTITDQLKALAFVSWNRLSKKFRCGCGWHSVRLSHACRQLARRDTDAKLARSRNVSGLIRLILFHLLTTFKGQMVKGQSRK